MKVLVSLKGRGKKMKRRGRMAQGYFTRRKGILRFYAFDNRLPVSSDTIQCPLNGYTPQLAAYYF